MEVGYSVDYFYSAIETVRSGLANRSLELWHGEMLWQFHLLLHCCPGTTVDRLASAYETTFGASLPLGIELRRFLMRYPSIVNYLDPARFNDTDPLTDSARLMPCLPVSATRDQVLHSACQNDWMDAYIPKKLIHEWLKHKTYLPTDVDAGSLTVNIWGDLFLLNDRARRDLGIDMSLCARHVIGVLVQILAEILAEPSESDKACVGKIEKKIPEYFAGYPAGKVMYDLVSSPIDMYNEVVTTGFGLCCTLSFKGHIRQVIDPLLVSHVVQHFKDEQSLFYDEPWFQLTWAFPNVFQRIGQRWPVIVNPALKGKPTLIRKEVEKSLVALGFQSSICHLDYIGTNNVNGVR